MPKNAHSPQQCTIVFIYLEKNFFLGKGGNGVIFICLIKKNPMFQ